MEMSELNKNAFLYTSSRLYKMCTATKFFYALKNDPQK